MKKAAILLAFLLLSACQPTAPTGPAAASEPSSSSAQAERPSSGGMQTVSQSPAESAPLPDKPPVTQAGALELPAQAATSAVGYGLELLTPAQYDMYMPMEHGDFRNFLTCDYFELGVEGKIALANRNGRMITAFDYEPGPGAWNAPEGIVPLQKDGAFGAVTAGEGKVLAPFQYDSVEAVPGSDLLRAQKGGDVVILNQMGAVRYQLERGDDFYVVGGTRELLRQSGMLRIYDHKSGAPLKNFACDALKVVADTAEGDELTALAIQYGGGWSLCDEDGGFLTDGTFEEIGHYKGDYAAMTKKGEKGVLNQKGEIVVKAEWDDLILYDGTASVCRDGKWGVISDLDSGVPSIEPMYDFIGGFGENSCAAFERNGKYGVIDKDGNEILSARFDSLIKTKGTNLERGYYLLDGNGGPGTAGIVDAAGKTIVPKDYIVLPGEEGEDYNLAATPAEKWGYINREGQFVIDAKYENAGTFLPNRDVAFVQKDGKIALIDRKGTVVLQTVFSDVIAYNPDTMVCAMEYTDAQGNVKCCLARLTFPQ